MAVVTDAPTDDPPAAQPQTRDATRRQWAAAMRVRQRQVTPRQQAAWAAAASLYPLVSDNGWLSAPEKTICSELGCSRPTWYRWLALWVDGGYIRQLVRAAPAGDGVPGRQSAYQCTVPIAAPRPAGRQ